jgi:predicted RNase H-like nuclease (RuvC/YqgF family)
MEELQINPYIIFGALEMVMLLLVISLALFVRSKLLGGEITELQKALRKAEDVEPPAPVRYEQYLRDEVLRNQAFIDRAAASEGDTGKKVGELLLMRKRFLELEVEASALENNPEAFQERLASGMNELIELLRPDPETATETVTETVEETVDSDSGASAGDDAEERSQLDTHDEEFDRLKQVITNQHEAMAALRAELQTREAEIEDLDVILAKLDEFEKHDDELQNCLAVLEKENQRLKEAHKSDSASGARIEPMDPAQLTGLKSMLGDQQQTIHNLQTLLQELAPEASKAKELVEAIAKIERANQELDGCVAVLEDENSMLRAELEAINAQLEQQALEEKAAEEIKDEPGIELETGDSETELSEDNEKHQLEIKVEELEALVEFKDAAIEELEKQYSSLESKYMAISSEKEVD